jgi:hypothetical protein
VTRVQMVLSFLGAWNSRRGHYFLRKRISFIDLCFSNNMNETTLREVSDELKSLKTDVNFLKAHMVDVDSILTEEDYKDLQDYRKDKKAGNLTSHEDLTKELGL